MWHPIPAPQWAPGRGDLERGAGREQRLLLVGEVREAVDGARGGALQEEQRPVAAQRVPLEWPRRSGVGGTRCGGLIFVDHRLLGIKRQQSFKECSQSLKLFPQAAMNKSVPWLESWLKLG